MDHVFYGLLILAGLIFATPAILLFIILPCIQGFSAGCKCYDWYVERR